MATTEGSDPDHHELSSAHVEGGRAVLSFTIHSRPREFIETLRALRFREHSQALTPGEWDALPFLDDRVAWVELRDPGDAFVVFVDRATGRLAALTDLDLTDMDVPAFLEAARTGVEVRVTFKSFTGAYTAKVRAMLE